jgi:hypothetical protein
MTNVKTPVSRAQQGLTAAVQGAAQGAHEILTLRRDTARVRSAIGHSKVGLYKLNARACRARCRGLAFAGIHRVSSRARHSRLS